jgi:hypothetical protein
MLDFCTREPRQELRGGRVIPAFKDDSVSSRRRCSVKALIILIAVMLPLATAASADRPNSDQASKAPATATFKSLDRNKDQSISKLEARSDKTFAANFDTADINLDGFVSKSEYDVYLQRSSGVPPKQE